MMITNLGFLTRILMVFHIKLTNQRLCNGLIFYQSAFQKLSIFLGIICFVSEESLRDAFLF